MSNICLTFDKIEYFCKIKREFIYNGSKGSDSIGLTGQGRVVTGQGRVERGSFTLTLSQNRA